MAALLLATAVANPNSTSSTAVTTDVTGVLY